MILLGLCAVDDIVDAIDVDDIVIIVVIIIKTLLHTSDSHFLLVDNKPFDPIPEVTSTALKEGTFSVFNITIL